MITLVWKIASFILAFFLALLIAQVVVQAIFGLLWMIHDVILKISQGVSYLYYKGRIKRRNHREKKSVEQQIFERDLARLDLLN